VEIFYSPHDYRLTDDNGEPMPAGWYFAFGFPGCLWDGEPMGPFKTYESALASARFA
jgi:hypothetical protein